MSPGVPSSEQSSWVSFSVISELTTSASLMVEKVKDVPTSISSAPPAITQSLAEARGSNRCLRAQSRNGVPAALPQRALGHSWGLGLAESPREP